MRIFSILKKNKNNIISYESDIIFKHNYKNYGDVVIKKYKKDTECINWLNSFLINKYQFESIMPVAQHEFRALEILNKYFLCPKPLELGVDYIVLERYGKELKNENNSNLYNQALNILNKLKEIDFKHNDLLKRNILIENGNLKLIDFTLSEFDNIKIIDFLPNKNWAYPGDDRILTYFNNFEDGHAS